MSEGTLGELPFTVMMQWQNSDLLVSEYLKSYIFGPVLKLPTQKCKKKTINLTLWHLLRSLDDGFDQKQIFLL
jgi:hypothetical protein